MKTEENNSFNLINEWSNIDLIKLRKWIDEQIKSGKTIAHIEVEWGYYNDIEDIYLVPERSK